MANSYLKNLPEPSGSSVTRTRRFQLCWRVRGVSLRASVYISLASQHCARPNVISWLTQKAERARKKCENRRCHVAHSTAQNAERRLQIIVKLQCDGPRPPALVNFSCKNTRVCSSRSHAAPFCCVSDFMRRGISFTAMPHNNRANWTFLSPRHAK